MEPRLNYFIIFFCCIIIIRCSGDKEAASPDDGLANNPPIINNQVFTVSEIIDNTAVIGEVIANDPDNDPLVFSIKTNSDNLFEISSLGILKLGNNQRLDFDKTSKHQIIIEVSDGLSNSEATIEINVEDSRPFITTWITTEPNEEIFIRTRESEFTYDYRISWGDGTTEIYNGDASHSYLTPGEYKISIKGVFPAIYFGNIIISQDKIHSIDQWGDIEWKTMESAFSNCENLTINATDAPNLESTSDLSFMFSQDSSLNGNLNNWDVSGIENMSGMFAGATSQLLISP
ncbi:MAG: BspA family leucine-rich repeat surface protein, partial [Bacteroidota bacterium]